jgi:hypothetical protein
VLLLKNGGPSRAAHETSYERAEFNSNSSRKINETSQLVTICTLELKYIVQTRLITNQASSSWLVYNLGVHEPLNGWSEFEI